MLDKIVNMIDKVAADLEEKGLTKEAEELDVIANTIEAGACPESGCIKKKPNGKWGVISNKSGKFWDADYDTKGDAEDALQAYHVGN